MPGADLKEMVTNFRNNKRRRRKVLGGTGGTFSWKYIFFLRVIYKNLTDFCKTVETGMDPRLDAILGDSLFTPQTLFSHASEHT